MDSYPATCYDGIHYFIWSSNTTTVVGNPPHGTLCQCGQMRYSCKPVRLHNDVELYTRLVPATSPQNDKTEIVS